MGVPDQGTNPLKDLSRLWDDWLLTPANLPRQNLPISAGGACHMRSRYFVAGLFGLVGIAVSSIIKHDGFRPVTTFLREMEVI
jgi:hypothetical protein